MTDRNRSGNKRPRVPLCLLFFLAAAVLIPATAGAQAAKEKLRVFVQPVSESLKQGSWKQPDREYARQVYTHIQRTLMQKGIYEVVPEMEVRALLKGEAIPAWRWKRNDWELARQTGRSLGADYAMILERGFDGFFYWRMTLINITTGKRFEDYDHLGPNETYAEIQRESYRRVFLLANGDMLATAIRKGKVGAAPSPPAAKLPVKAPAPPAGPIEAPPGKAPPTPTPAEPAKLPPVAVTPTPARPAAPSPPLPQKESHQPAAAPQAQAPDTGAPAIRPPQTQAKSPAAPAGAETRRAPIPGQAKVAVAERTRLIVYDFEAAEDLRVAGMILAEALRGELQQMGRYTLINREDMVKALEEQKLKWAGIISEESGDLGKWLMAGEIVTGRFGRLGDSTVLQAKRTDLQTMNTHAIESIKCPAGKEDELLAGIPGLARRLAETR